MLNYFQSLNLLTSEELLYLEEKSYTRQLNKGDYFIREGEINHEIAWIKKGIIRSFYTTEKGDEFTYCILFENTLITALSSYISGKPTTENMQAVCNTQLEVIKKEDIVSFMKSSVNFMKVEKMLIEKEYIELEKRMFSFQKENAAERYNELLKNQSEYIKQIPLQHLASYLGISLRHLSRIRKSVL
ncbi:Crp/Fnr family transcriptional regulator [Apibacter raozihei]|uniref:Crp/Fnr family transcriptional regulator n=1 Tax=Apibacter raozihei TaxID=2500547 RepID=UPI000FE37B7C|nr:Crp/Fnr family transcriptional regulator [Apibacter raozihei]